MALAVLCLGSANAQTVYDAAKIAGRELNGTARFVGMGGAMSALGGDISTIRTNPAGIGIYRSNDVMATFGYSITSTESNYEGNKFNMDKARWTFDNLGFVLSTKFGNRTNLRYFNVGFNYQKRNSFYKNMTMQGLLGTFEGQYVSQVRYMAQQATDAQKYLHDEWGQQLVYGSKDIYTDEAAGWLGAMGFQGWLINEKGDDNLHYYDPVIPNEVDGYFLSRERGGINEYDFNMAFNINDRFYLGVTLGAYDVDYNKYSLYDEDYGTGEGYALNSYNRIHGTGVDLKLGAIVRPFEYSPLRIGLAVHTPTFYRLTYTTGALLQADLFFDGKQETDRVNVDTYEQLGGRDMDREFNLVTPWLVNASVGYTVGNSLAVDAEYEYENYSNMKFRYPDSGEEMQYETIGVNNSLKAVHTFKVGAEYKPVSAFSIRAGYNFSSAAFKKDAIKALPSNSINTDTDFANTQDMNTFSVGIGYRGSAFYADLAYKLDTYNADFYPFYNEIETKDGWMLVTPPATKVTTSRSKVMLTVGYRF